MILTGAKWVQFIIVFTVLAVELVHSVAVSDDAYRCTDGEIRLYDPEIKESACDATICDYGEGFLQVCIDEEWAYLCGAKKPAFTGKAAEVACNQLGYLGYDSSTEVLPENIHGNNIAQINVHCTGFENRLIDCFESPDNGCKEMDVIITVNCSNDETVCTNGEIKLDEHDSISYLKVCASGKWHHLCGGGWGNGDAETACRQLGENPNGAQGNFNKLDMAGDTVSNMMFHCSGNERRLSDCPGILLDECTSQYEGMYKVAVLHCGAPVMKPLSLEFSISNSEVTISWLGSTQLEYKISCTHLDSLTSTSTEIRTTTMNSTSTVLTGFLAQSDAGQYNCCVTAIAEDTQSEPTCELFTMNSGQSSSLLITDYKVWLYGFICIVVLCTVVVLVACGLLVALCQTRRSMKNYILHNQIQCNNGRTKSRTDSNPLYVINDNTQEKYEIPVSSRLPSNNCYIAAHDSNIDQRPPAQLPIDAPTYHTITLD